MIQAYMDESAQGNYFVLAGYVSSVPKWAAFSDAWDKLLHHGSSSFPRLEEFKMSQMMESRERMEMVPWFYREIESHVDFGLSVVVPVTAAQDAFDKIAWPDWMDRPERFKNPYLIAFDVIFESLRMFGRDLGISEKVDFIFDKRLGDDKLCEEAWREMSKDRRFKDLCGEDPIFRDSKLTLPIQAADFYAYWVREWSEHGERPTTGYLPFPWWDAERDIPSLATYVDANGFQAVFEAVVKQAEAERAGIMPPPVYRFIPLDRV